MADEQLQNVKFGRRQRHRLAVERDFLGLVAERDAAERVFARSVAGLHAAELRIAPQLGADARQHLHRVERLCHIVVRTDVQPEDLVRVLAFCRQQDDRQIVGLAQLDRGVNAVHHGHHDVHQHEMDVLLGEDVQRLLAGVGAECAVTFGTEVDFQRGHNVALVVADQNVVHVSVLRIQEYHSRI